MLCALATQTFASGPLRELEFGNLIFYLCLTMWIIYGCRSDSNTTHTIYLVYYIYSKDLQQWETRGVVLGRGFVES